SPTPSPTPTPGIERYVIDEPPIATPTPVPTFTPKPTPSPTPSPTPDRKLRDDADPYRDKEKVALDEDRILPELREIYALNHDLVGWLYAEGTNIDYPVVQHEDPNYYLRRDFYGNDNANGQIILYAGCDPYTPSYNLVISGHHMNSGAMFGRLQEYRDSSYWQTHRLVEFDSLMERKQYVVFAAFYSADYDEYEEGFRYSVNIQFKVDYDRWIKEIRANQLYPTGIDVAFGDEFITLTTCDHSRRDDGRFVVVARRIREGEIFQ
ncbi:MAG: class B sortase, partial [Clostridia bacterium]|nr:class B sortase [Clostridia bacterium]